MKKILWARIYNETLFLKDQDEFSKMSSSCDWKSMIGPKIYYQQNKQKYNEVFEHFPEVWHPEDIAGSVVPLTEEMRDCKWIVPEIIYTVHIVEGNQIPLPSSG